MALVNIMLMTYAHPAQSEAGEVMESHAGHVIVALLPLNVEPPVMMDVYRYIIIPFLTI